MAYIEKKILQHRVRPARIRILTSEGRPLPNIFITVEQKSSLFNWGVRLKGEEISVPGFSEHLHRFTHHLLVEWPPSPPVQEILKSASWKVTAEVHLHPHQPLKEWAKELRQVLEEIPSLHLERWALFPPERDLRGIPEEIRRAQEILEEQTGRPSCLFGLTFSQILSLDITEAGLSLIPPSGERWHLGELYRILQQLEEASKEVYLYNLYAPAKGFFYTRRSEELGGSERSQSDYLADIVTLGFSSPAVKGIYFKSLTDSTKEERPTGLVTAEGRPRRAYKILRRMIHQNWRFLGYGVTDETGEWAFNGFCGEYQITVIPSKGQPLLFAQNLPPGQGEVLWEVILE